MCKRNAIFNGYVVRSQFAGEFLSNQFGNMIDILFAFQAVFDIFRRRAGVDHVSKIIILSADFNARNREVVQFAEFFTNVIN